MLDGPPPTLASGRPPGLWRHITFAVVRIVVITTLLLVVYFEAPLGRDNTTAGLVLFVLALVGFGLAMVVQVRRILDDPVPRVRAGQTLGTAVPVFIILFSLAYVAIDQSDPANFTQPLSRLGALYFTVTVLSTVGFGDITARSDFARTIVTIQMLLDLVLIGVVVKVVIGASRIGMERREAERRAASPPGSDP